MNVVIYQDRTAQTQALANIVEALVDEQQRSYLTDWIRLNIVIMEAIGGVSPNMRTKLSDLNSKYERINNEISLAAADTSSLMTKFVDNAVRAIKLNCLTEERLQSLKKHTPNDTYLGELETFVKTSWATLDVIQTMLIENACGELVKSYLSNRSNKEAELTTKLNLLYNEEQVVCRLEGDVARLEFEQTYNEQCMKDIAAAKQLRQEELTALEGQIQTSEEKLLAHRDYSRLDNGSVWFVSWSVNVQQDNGERIAQTLHAQLLARIAALKSEINSTSDANPAARLATVKAELETAKKSIEPARQIVTALKEQCTVLKTELAGIVNNIKSLYEGSGCYDPITLGKIDTLSKGIKSASVALNQSHRALRIHIGDIEVNAEKLEESVISAIKIIRLSEELVGMPLLARTEKSVRAIALTAN